MECFVADMVSLLGVGIIFFAWYGKTWFYGSFYEVISCGGCGWLLVYYLWCWWQEDDVLGEEVFLYWNIVPLNKTHKKTTVIEKKNDIFSFVVYVYYFDIIRIIDLNSKLVLYLVKICGIVVQVIIKRYKTILHEV